MIHQKMCSRRQVLRGAGAVLALPALEALGAAQTAVAPRRMVAIQTTMGIMPQFFFPRTTGRDYELTPYLELLKDFKNDMTVFSGMSHPRVDGGHQAELAFLTGAPHPGRNGFKNTISLDQFAAERIGHQTRFASLTTQVGQGGRTLSWTRSGAMIPGDKSPAELYRKLFIQGKPEEVRRQIAKLREGRSIMDVVGDRAKSLLGQVGAANRDRLDQYFTSVREVEQRLLRAEAWERKDKPKVKAGTPKDEADRNQVVRKTQLMYDLVHLALETDSTRLVTIYINPASVVPTIEGVNAETHSLTHHGNRPEKVAQLRRIEEEQFKVLGRFLGNLRSTQEQGKTLLDQTMVLYGTCMGSANSHSNHNLPVLLAGGGFKHGQHLAFDPKNNRPLADVYLAMLHRMGIEADRFSSGERTVSGLDMA